MPTASLTLVTMDENNHATWRRKVKVNYGAQVVNWKKISTQEARAMEIHEWDGGFNKLTKAALLEEKEMRLNFVNIPVDLTGYETAILEVIVEADEVVE